MTDGRRRQPWLLQLRQPVITMLVVAAGRIVEPAMTGCAPWHRPAVRPPTAQAPAALGSPRHTIPTQSKSISVMPPVSGHSLRFIWIPDYGNLRSPSIIVRDTYSWSSSAVLLKEGLPAAHRTLLYLPLSSAPLMPRWSVAWSVHWTSSDHRLLRLFRLLFPGVQPRNISFSRQFHRHVVCP